MRGRPYILGETSWQAVRDTPYNVAVLPWGATEAHNYHLPYATDNIQVAYVAAESARLAWDQGARVIVLPTVPFGVNTGQLDVKLDINMMPSTQAALLADIVQVLSRQKIRKFVVLNGHGGNSFRQMIRETGVRYPDMFICEINWFKVLKGAEYFDEPGDHGGEMETSNLLCLAPELVLPLSEAGCGHARKSALAGIREGWVWAERRWPEVTEDTGVGDPSLSTREKGKRFLDALTLKFSDFLVELSNQDLEALYVLPDGDFQHPSGQTHPDSL